MRRWNKTNARILPEGFALPHLLPMQIPNQNRYARRNNYRQESNPITHSERHLSMPSARIADLIDYRNVVVAPNVSTISGKPRGNHGKPRDGRGKPRDGRTLTLLAGNEIGPLDRLHAD